MRGRLGFGVLGPLVVTRDGVEVAVSRRRQQLVLARLLVDAGRVVPAERIMEDLWGPVAARRGTGPVRTNVWELRRLLHPSNGGPAGDDPDPDPDDDVGEAAADTVLVSRPGGYLLDVDRHQVDGARFDDLLAAARTVGPAAPEQALSRLDEALGLWRGPAFGDLAGELALRPEATRLDNLVLEARELRAELLIDVGRCPQVAAELDALARAHPERERLWALLMTALYRSGRQSEALRCYQEARSCLVDAVGVEPGPELQQLEQAILHHDPALHRPVRRHAADRRGLVVTSADTTRTPGASAAAGTADTVDGAGITGASMAAGAAEAATGEAAGAAGMAENSGPAEVPGIGASVRSGRLGGATSGRAGSPSSRRPPDLDRFEAASVPGLPRPLTPLVGRDAERRAVAAALDRSRLVTVLGVGGCGKTRLAVAVAEDVALRFPGGVWFVDLASASTTDPLPAVVAAALGDERGLLTTDGSPGPARPTGDEALLVLDNCEHLVDAVAGYVVHLLAHGPSLRVLATSREELRVEGEAVWRLPGLAVPERNGGPFLGSEAVELFVRRGAAHRPEFAPQGDALELVGQICRRLDGLPLAIELAAALVGTLPLTEIARRLDHRFGSLTGWRGHHAPRHRTLRAALDWSFELLDPASQRLFTTLGVFVGTFDLAAVAALVVDGEGDDGASSGGTLTRDEDSEPEPSPAPADGVGRLVRSSLVEPVGDHDGVQRYRLLETVRQYALERLERRDDAHQVRRRHARYFADLAARADRGMRGQDSPIWMDRIEAELPNLRAALTWAMAHDAELALRMLSSLRWFLSHLAVLDDLAAWLDGQMARRSQLVPTLQLSLTASTSIVALLTDQAPRARQVAAEAAALARRLDEPEQLVPALLASAGSALTTADWDDAQRQLSEAHLLSTRLGDRWGLACALAGLGILSHQAGRPDVARGQMGEALRIWRDLRDLRSQVFPLGVRALQALADDEVEVALELATEAAHIVTSLGFDVLGHFVFGVLGLAHLAAFDLVAAREQLLRSIRQFQDQRSDAVLWACLGGLAILASAAGRHDDAVMLLGAAEQVDQLSASPAPKWTATIDAVLARADHVLGPEGTRHCLARGRSLPLDEALALAETATASLVPDPAPD